MHIAHWCENMCGVKKKWVGWSNGIIGSLGIIKIASFFLSLTFLVSFSLSSYLKQPHLTPHIITTTTTTTTTF